jgi:hypothetical protein
MNSAFFMLLIIGPRPDHSVNVIRGFAEEDVTTFSPVGTGSANGSDTVTGLWQRPGPSAAAPACAVGKRCGVCRDLPRNRQAGITLPRRWAEALNSAGTLPDVVHRSTEIGTERRRLVVQTHR